MAKSTKHSWFHFFKIHPKDETKDQNIKESNKDEKKSTKVGKHDKKNTNEVKISDSTKSVVNKASGLGVKSKTVAPSTEVILNANGQPEAHSSSTTKTGLKKKEQFNAPSVLSKPIIIQFLYQNKKIANDYIFTGEIGQVLDITKIPPVTGYDLPSADQLNYSVTDHTQVIPLEMHPQLIHYRLVPVTENHEVIDKKYIEALNGQPGESIVFSDFPHIPGYQAYTTRIYIVPNKAEDLQITYAPVQQSLTVVFITTSGLTR